MSTPIVIGVTGHRDLREQDIPLLRSLVHSELNKIKTEYPHSPLKMLNSLAKGADWLCAEEALSLGIFLVCVLPMETDDYRKDFEGEDLMRFNTLLKQASETFTAPSTEPVPEVTDRDYYYRQAGIYVATHSHVLLALWDGTPAKKDGCGTAEATGFMLQNYHDDKKRPYGAVIHIKTPRMKNNNDIQISRTLIESKKGCLREALEGIERLNILCDKS